MATATSEVVKREDTLFGWTLASQAINLSKGLTGPVLLACVLMSQNFGYGAVAYTGMHGLYGYLWVLKQVYFPDKNFVKRPSEVVGFNLGMDFDVQSPMVENLLYVILFISVSLYWAGGISLILAKDQPDVGSVRLASAVVIYAFGIFLHFGADIQKYERLKYKKGLITDGFFSLCRSPGYLGEVLIYGAFFSLCPWGYPLLVSVMIMVLGLPTFLIGKERSISRHPEYAEYSKRVKLLIPYIF